MIKSAVINGGASGIGRSYAKHLAARGANIVLVDKKQEEMVALADQLALEHGVDVATTQADLSQPVEQIEVAKRSGAIEDLDLLVNSAGFGAPVAFHELDPQVHINMLNVHVASTIRCCRAAILGMLARKRGNIINISSQMSFLFAGENSTYGSTRVFVDTFTRNLNEAYARRGLNFQVLCPAYTKTDFHNSRYYGKEAIEKVPIFYWNDADYVTEYSLTQLPKKRLVCVPGFNHKVMYFVLKNRLVPRFILRKVAI